MSISLNELYWAGFLEGEGCFTSGRGANGAWQVRVSASQVHHEPLDRLVKLFGGKIYLRRRKEERHQDIGIWIAFSPRLAIAIMMTVWPLMSSRRKEQIEACIAKWKENEIPSCGPKHARHIKRGESHPRAKLTNDLVRAIRASTESHAVLARTYSISPNHIYKIRAAQFWKHIPNEGEKQ